MADLATEKPKVQKRLAEYGRDLLSLGVAGLRVDAAKRSCRSEPSSRITNRIPPQTFRPQIWLRS